MGNVLEINNKGIEGVEFVQRPKYDEESASSRVRRRKYQVEAPRRARAWGVGEAEVQCGWSEQGLSWIHRQGSDYGGIYMPLKAVWVALDLTERVGFSAGFKSVKCREIFGSRHLRWKSKAMGL